MTLLLDYAWARPTPATIKTAGYTGVLRYLSPDPSKNLTPAERDALLAAGLTISLVWESTTGRAAQGAVAGTADMRQAEAQAAALGYPATCPIFYAVDSGALTPGDVAPYFAGITAVARYRVGVYGSLTIIEGTNVPWKWQTNAWSAGLVSPTAHLYQRLAPTVAHPIADTDENTTLRAFPTWTVTGPVVTQPPAATPPRPAGGLTVNVIDLRTTRTITGPGIPPMQRLLRVKDDGAAGPITRAALGTAQNRIFHTIDYQFGEQTASALLAGR